MTRARTLSRLANSNVLAVDSSNNVGIGSTIPDAKLDVIGIVSATSFYGDGSGLIGVASTDNIITSTASTMADIYSTGIVTATTFVGALTGNASGLTGSPNITINNLVGVAATFSGVVTYEDVTNIDSVGIVTAGKGLRATTGGIIVTAGVSTLAGTIVAGITTIDASGVNVTGILTALGLDISTGGVDIDGHTELDDLNVTGVSTLSSYSYFTSRVAVGTDASPGYPLDVQQAIRIRHDGSNLGKVLFSGGGTRIQYSDSTGNLSFYTNSAERCYVGYGGGLYVSSGALTVTTHSALNTIVASGICTASKFDGPGNVPAGQTGTVTLAASDAGKHVAATSTVTLGTGIFAVGDAVTIYNNSGSGITITLSAVTCYNAADGTTGNRTLGARGLATILCTATNTYVISGAGLT